ncbi:glycosyltransferase [Streptomyces sp. NPDC020799]|uniref:glycosyltransferase n=1 Tax=Streptomyces sp. NPDC020799 TaxID=3365091 RepID=UPI0037A1D279
MAIWLPLVAISLPALVASTVISTVRAGLACWAALRLQRSRDHPIRPAANHSVTIVIPAYNEETGIAAAIRSALTSTHSVEVVVIDDGSTDKTAAIAAGFKGVRVIRQGNQGKARALNTALATVRTDLVVMMDADAVLEPTAVASLVHRFTDPTIGAVSGHIDVAGGGLLGAWQRLDYALFNLERCMFDRLGGMPTVPGVIGAFRSNALDDVGGVPEHTVAEDTDLTMTLQKNGWRIAHETTARARTEVPFTHRDLVNQRHRWAYGILQALWRHRSLDGKDMDASRRLSHVGVPFEIAVHIAAPLMVPFVDVALLTGLFTGNHGILFLYLTVQALQLACFLVASRTDIHRARLWAALPILQVIFSHVTAFVVLKAMITALAGLPVSWDQVQRRAY